MNKYHNQRDKQNSRLSNRSQQPQDNQSQEDQAQSQVLCDLEYKGADPGVAAINGIANIVSGATANASKGNVPTEFSNQTQ